MDCLYHSFAFLTMLKVWNTEKNNMEGTSVTHKSSLIVDGFPNWVAVERSRL